MANTIQLKRRVSGNAGAPAGLKSGELAHNEVDNTMYVGKGDDGSGNATSIVALAGRGAFVDVSTMQTIGGAKTFSSAPKSSQDASAGSDLVRKSQLDLKAALASPALTGTPTAPTATSGTSSTQIATTAFVQQEITGFGAGDMAKSVYDTDNDGKVDAAGVADAVPWTGITGKPATFAASAHSHAISDVSGLQTALDAKAPLANPAFSGSPTTPTASAGTNTIQIASTAFVQAAILHRNGEPAPLPCDHDAGRQYGQAGLLRRTCLVVRRLQAGPDQVVPIKCRLRLAGDASPCLYPQGQVGWPEGSGHGGRPWHRRAGHGPCRL